MMGELVTLGVAVAAAVLGAGLALGVARRGRRRERTRAEELLAEVDRDLLAMSERLEALVARMEGARSASGGSLGLVLDFDELLDRLVSEAAARTGADAVAVRVDGPAGEPVVASFGAEDGDALLGAALGPPDARPFRALTINWTQGPAPDGAEGAYESAVVVPIAEEGAQTGVLVAYGRESGAFQAEDVQALQGLADEVAGSLQSARRFAVVERRTGHDPTTGARNRTGYAAELEREVDRARRTGKPLSVLLLQLGDAGGSSANRALPEIAALLTRLTRGTDALCRPREHELAVLLPGTKGTGARQFFARVRDEATETLAHVGPLTFSAGLVEWRPDETSESLAARVATAVRTVETMPGEARAGGAEPTEEESGSFEDELAAAVARARRESTSLTLLVVELDPPAGGDELRSRLAEIVAGSGASGQLAPGRFGAILHATATDAETAIAVLREALRASDSEALVRATVSAGITELVSADDRASLLERAERAVSQARQAGDGTVVVATANGSH
jgi:diguanylate cyclase (GGDEF)-like protein